MTIVADTGAIIGLVDADDKHHAELRALYEKQPRRFVLPWAILPEVDYLLAARCSPRVAQTFLNDVAETRFAVEWGQPVDMIRARDLNARYVDLQLGLVDCIVIAVAERLQAKAIATLDLRHFGAVTIKGAPKLLPRDLESKRRRPRSRR